jgi:organic radical activating enzyme
MSQRYFPIHTSTACQLKWNWSTVRLYNGTTSSCHRVDSDSVTVENFSNFHNTAKKIADRQLMLEGKWPTGGCEYCTKIETAGGTSDRMFHLQIPNYVPPELATDPRAVIVSPSIVEVYFDNTCNMSCLYCWDGFSSKIQQENIKFGRFEKHGVVIDNHASLTNNRPQLTEAFWKWFVDNHQSVKRFHVLGGEPFYQTQFEQCLQFLETHPCPDLEFNVISNLKISTDRLTNFFDRIKKLLKDKKIKRFDLTASIDCFGKEQEYVRYGIDLEQWKKNFELAVSCKWIHLNINQTLSALTVKTVPELIAYLNGLNLDREIGHYFGTTVLTHEFLHPGIFGPRFFSNDFDAIISGMSDRTWQQRQAKQNMIGIKSQIETSKRDVNKVQQLGIFLDEIDRRRNLNWRETFPWLAEEIKNVVQQSHC